MHDASHPMAGKTVLLNDLAEDPLRGILLPGVEFDVEDWYDLVRGGQNSWQQDQTWTTLHYWNRLRAIHRLADDEVVYGHVGGLGHIVHTSELGKVVRDWMAERLEERA